MPSERLAPPMSLRLKRRPLLASAAAVLFLAGCATPAPPPPAPPPPGLTPAQKSALRSLDFTELPDADWSLDLGARFGFELDAATVSPQNIAALSRVAHVLLDVGITKLTVEGHTDAQGSEVHNQRLSERRAEVVAQALAANGFKLENITRRGLGSGRPVGDNATAAGRTQNRRAALIVPSL